MSSNNSSSSGDNGGEYYGLLIECNGHVSVQSLKKFRAETLESGAVVDGRCIRNPILKPHMGTLQSLFVDDQGYFKRLEYNALGTLLYQYGTGNDGIILGPALLVDDEHQFSAADAEAVKREYSAAARILSSSTSRAL